jgi:hypothetical protein
LIVACFTANFSLLLALCLVSAKPVREMATFICGEQSKHFDIEPKLPNFPSQDDLERGRVALKEGMAKEASNYFANQFDQGRKAQNDSLARFHSNYFAGS